MTQIFFVQTVEKETVFPSTQDASKIQQNSANSTLWPCLNQINALLSISFATWFNSNKPFHVYWVEVDIPSVFLSWGTIWLPLQRCSEEHQHHTVVTDLVVVEALIKVVSFLGFLLNIGITLSNDSKQHCFLYVPSRGRDLP